MPVNTQRQEFKDMAARWERCRDCYEGSDAVKGKGVKYLPMLEGMQTVPGAAAGYNSAYTGYKDRALFLPAYARTVAGLAGLVFSKAPTQTDFPKSSLDDFDDVTLSGVSLLALALDLCQEILSVGRCGILLDMPAAPAPQARPYWVKFPAERIINWRTSRIAGRYVLTQLVLCETVETAKVTDPWESEKAEQYRVLELVNGVYQITIWTQVAGDKTKFVQGDPMIPLRRGQPLNFIPFVVFGPSGTSPAIEVPPLLPLADVNLSHYRTSADHEHGAHFVALPTPWVSGHTVEAGGTLAIGSGTAWVFPDKEARVGMLEFSGAGLKALSDLKEEKRLMMISLGAKMLETQKNTAEAAQTVRLRHAGERSALSVLAGAEGRGLSALVQWHLWWSGVDDAPAMAAHLSLNPDALNDLSADDVRALVMSWQANAISHKTLLYNLEWGEWLRPETTIDEELADIAAEGDTVPPPLPGE